VFREIRKQTKYNVICDASILSKDYQVSVNLKSASLEDAMEECLKDLPLTFLVSDKNIVVNTKNTVAAQVNTVKGIVADQNGEPLPGVVVTAKSTGRTTQTIGDGSFVINLSQQSDELIF